MKISVIGSGNVATHLGNAFYRAGHHVAEVFSRSREHAALLAERVGARAVTDLADLSGDLDLCLIAIKDDAISGVLSALKPALELSGGILAHTAGSIPLEILKGNARNCGVFYPFQTFSKFREPDFRELPFCIEANNRETFQLLEGLAKGIGGKPYGIDSEQRKTLHLAAVFAANFSNHLYVVAEEMLKEKQLPFDIIRPLIKETAEKVMQSSPFEAQTGPALRGDLDVLESHLSLLGDYPGLKQIYGLREIYKLLTESIFRQHRNL